MTAPDFARFDQRQYPTVSARDGYRGWLPSYESSVEDHMDLDLLDRVTTVPWHEATRVADLGCGTGRTARWLRTRTQSPIDGVDLTPEMLAVARTRRLHDSLVRADVRATGLPDARYDLVVCSLVDEHLPSLAPLYAEARRLLHPGGVFVLVGYHPFFMMASGMATHFDDPAGQSVAIETYVHLSSEHVGAATAAGFVASELHEGLIDDTWVELKPGWATYRDWPVSFVWVWRVGTERVSA